VESKNVELRRVLSGGCQRLKGWRWKNKQINLDILVKDTKFQLGGISSRDLKHRDCSSNNVL
jgi:hypothetical protein